MSGEPTPDDVAGMVTFAREGARQCRVAGSIDRAVGYEQLANFIEALDAAVQAERERADKAERVRDNARAQAESWAQEARTQRATVHDAYQAATGATGEPGDWHGAQPVRDALAAADAAGYARAMGEVDRAIGALSGHEGDSVTVFVSSFGKCWNVASREHGTSEAVHPTSPVAAILAAASALIDAAERPTPPAPRFNDATTTGTAADVVVVNALVHGGPPRDSLDDGR